MKKFISIFILSLIFIATKADTHYINSGNYYYSPSSLTINVNDTVVWLNIQGYHNVNFISSSISGNSFNNPVSFISSPTVADTLHEYVFTITGTYQYDCSVGSHAASGMIGTIIVNQPVITSNTVYDIISNSADHTILEIAIDTCGLASTLDGPGPFTVFAPTDAAFNALPAGTISSLLSNLPALTDILKYHVVGDSVMSSMLSNGQTVTTLEGSNVTVTISGGNVYIENAMVTVADIVGDNGVVHVIDAVLLPPTPSNINELNSDDKVIYTVDILGKIVVGQEKKNMILFDIYESGKTIRRLVIN